jgi:hypothetical protein
MKKFSNNSQKSSLICSRKFKKIIEFLSKNPCSSVGFLSAFFSVSDQKVSSFVEKKVAHNQRKAVL